MLTGIELLSKLNAGITLAALALVALFAAPAPRLRPAAAFAGGAVVAVVVGWFAAGQSISSIGRLPDGLAPDRVGLLRGDVRSRIPTAAWEFWAAFLVTGLGFAVAWRGR